MRVIRSAKFGAKTIETIAVPGTARAPGTAFQGLLLNHNQDDAINISISRHHRCRTSKETEVYA